MKRSQEMLNSEMEVSGACLEWQIYRIPNIGLQHDCGGEIYLHKYFEGTIYIAGFVNIKNSGT